MNITPPTPNPISGTPPTGKQAYVQDRKELKAALQEQFSPEAFQEIDAAWKSNPDVRTEVMQQARQFSADTNYPTPAQLTQLAQMIVGDTMSLPPTTTLPPTTPPAAVPPSTDTQPPVAA
jgi:hypothetical protein